jgi:molybdenum cofactor cytidylyltransferase
VREQTGTIITVILAAGFSSRLGFDKLFIRIDGETVIRRAVRPFLGPPVSQVLVVAGRNGERVREHLGDLPATVVVNAHPERGMSASVAAALPYIGGADAIFFHLGDKPFVREGLVAEMVRAFRAGGSPVAAACHLGERGHPVLVDRGRFMDDMGRLSGDMGLREVIEKHSGDMICIEGGPGCLIDIDTVEDVGRLRKRGYDVEEG